jgi:hypothetical protein
MSMCLWYSYYVYVILTLSPHILVQVMSKYIHRTCIDYCAYGGCSKKQTMLFSSFDLIKYHFKKATCLGAQCLGKLQGSCNHEPWESTSRQERQAIPKQVSTQVGNAVCTFLQSRNVPSPRSSRSVTAPWLPCCKGAMNRELVTFAPLPLSSSVCVLVCFSCVPLVALCSSSVAWRA